MRKIRIFEHTSLDGVIQPGGPSQDSDFANGGWTTPYRTPAGALGPRPSTRPGLRSAARPPHLRSLGHPLAHDQNRPLRRTPQRRHQIRRHPQTGHPHMGSGQGPRRGHPGRHSRPQVQRRPRPDRLGKFHADDRAARAGIGRRGCADRLPGSTGPRQTLLFR